LTYLSPLHSGLIPGRCTV